MKGSMPKPAPKGAKMPPMSSKMPAGKMPPPPAMGKGKGGKKGGKGC